MIVSGKNTLSVFLCVFFFVCVCVGGLCVCVSAHVSVCVSMFVCARPESLYEN